MSARMPVQSLADSCQPCSGWEDVAGCTGARPATSLRRVPTLGTGIPRQGGREGLRCLLPARCTGSGVSVRISALQAQADVYWCFVSFVPVLSVGVLGTGAWAGTAAVLQLARGCRVGWDSRGPGVCQCMPQPGRPLAAAWVMACEGHAEGAPAQAPALSGAAPARAGEQGLQLASQASLHGDSSAVHGGFG